MMERMSRRSGLQSIPLVPVIMGRSDRIEGVPGLLIGLGRACFASASDAVLMRFFCRG